MLKLVLPFLLAASVACHGATIEKAIKVANGVSFISIAGEIEAGDAQRFEEAARDIPFAIVGLQSPGGSVVEGLEIGRRIRKAGFVTAVPPDTLCASVCALMWLAGTRRFAESDSYVGFHAAYIVRDGVPVETGTGNALIGSYLNSLGFRDQTIIYVTTAPPRGMDRLNKAKAKSADINYESVADLPQAPSPALATQPPLSALEVVERFYRALSSGDGEAAAAFVIPDKRGVGPFNEVNISTFYRSLKEPLVIRSISQHDDTTFVVKYTFRATRTQCVGEAIVQTQYILQRNLIRGIRANC